MYVWGGVVSWLFAYLVGFFTCFRQELLYVPYMVINCFLFCISLIKVQFYTVSCDDL